MCPPEKHVKTMWIQPLHINYLLYINILVGSLLWGLLEDMEDKYHRHVETGQTKSYDCSLSPPAAPDPFLSYH